MTHRRFALASVAVALALTALPATAQTPMDDPLDARDARRVDRMERVVRELRSIVFQGRDTGRPVVVQPAETDFQLQELARRVEDLELALTRVNNQLETNAHELNQVRREAESLRADNRGLAQRLAALEQAGVQPAEASADPAAPPAEAAPEDAGEAFTRARQLMLNGDYAAAEGAFQDFVARHGENPRAPEARYWLGKTLVARGAHADAATAFIGAIRGWPTTNWAPDAVVELSRSLVALERPKDACQTLAELSKRYPKAPPAVTSRATAARTQAKCA